jgi:hypothetical protein
MIIDPSSVSFSQIKTDIIEYLNAKPEAAVWKDFYESGVGTTFIELLAGFATYNSYTTTVGRRETYLFHIENRSSGVAIAQSLGHSCFRGKNVHLSLNITPSATEVITDMSVIGTYKEYSIVSIGSYALTVNIPITIEVVLGSLKSESIDIESDALKIFRFESILMSDDIQLKLNGNILPLSETILDLLEDRYVGLSNSLGALDIMYLNQGSYKYVYGDTLILYYIELKEFTFSSISDLSLTNGIVNTATTINIYQIPETIPQIQINAPLTHEIGSVVKGRNDFKDILKFLIAGAVDTNAYDVSAAVIELTYVKEDLTLLTALEKVDILEELDVYRPFGILLPTIKDPTQINIALAITITLNTLLDSVGQGVIDNDIATISAIYEKLLGITMDLTDVEYDIEGLSYVKVARVATSGTLSLNWTEYFIISTSITLIEP